MEHDDTSLDNREQDTGPPDGPTEEQQAELKLALAELAFWLDFAKWWRTKYCGQEAPRIDELLEQAEQRYLRAGSCEKTTKKSRNYTTIPFLRDPGAKNVD